MSAYFDRFERVSGPTTEPISLADAKAQLRVESDFTEEDDYISSLIVVARQKAEDYCSRYFAEQTIDIFFTTAPSSGELYLNLPDIVSVDSVTYYDEAGDPQSLGTYKYNPVRKTVSYTDLPQYYGAIVRVTCGKEHLLARMAQLLIISDLYEHRATDYLPSGAAIHSLLSTLRHGIGI